MAGDADGWKRGEKGYGKDAASTKWAKTVDFNRERQQGPLTDGGYPQTVEPHDKDKGFKGVRR